MSGRWLLRRVGWFLVVVSTLAMLVWWIWGLPFVRGFAAPWTKLHSTAGLWEAKQPKLRSGWWMHDDGWVVGWFGDRDWTKRIMDWIAHDDQLFGCERGHPELALEYMTNHSPDTSTSDVKLGDSWMAWWNTNRDRTQEQWIADGFAEAGFPVQLPPTHEDWPTLLRVLGACAGPGLPRGRAEPLYPDFLRFNAYRWLRDSDFNPVLFLLDAASTTSDGDLRGGLLAYTRFERELNSVLQAGRSSFGKHLDAEFQQLPQIPAASIAWQDCVSMWMLGGWLLGGLLLLIPKIVWTDPALNDLDAIADYIALDKPDAATRLVQQVFGHVEMLAAHPNLGSRIPELRRGSRYRQVVEAPRRVFYRHDAKNKKMFAVGAMAGERQFKKAKLLTITSGSAQRRGGAFRA